MITLIDKPVTLFGGKALVEDASRLTRNELAARLAAKGVYFDGIVPTKTGEGTMARRIVEAHHTDKGDGLLTTTPALDPFSNQGYLVSLGAHGAWIYKFDALDKAAPSFYIPAEKKEA